MSPDDPRHGSNAGAQKHRRDGEEPCTPCLVAAAAYQREWRRSADNDYTRQLARGRAMSALARIYPEEFQRLYVAEVREALGSPRPDAEIVRKP